MYVCVLHFPLFRLDFNCHIVSSEHKCSYSQICLTEIHWRVHVDTLLFFNVLELSKHKIITCLGPWQFCWLLNLNNPLIALTGTSSEAAVWAVSVEMESKIHMRQVVAFTRVWNSWKHSWAVSASFCVWQSVPVTGMGPVLYLWY